MSLKKTTCYIQLSLFPEIVAEEDIENIQEDEGILDVDIQYTCTRRILRLLSLLSVNRCSRQEILERMEDFYTIDDDASKRATLSSQKAGRKFLRDIRFLQGVGYQIETTGSGRDARYQLSPGSGPAPLFSLTQDELSTLLLLMTLFYNPENRESADTNTPASYGHPFASSILALLTRLTSSLPSEQKRYLQESAKKPSIYLHADTVIDYTPYLSTIKTIRNAFSLGRRLRFIYGASGRKDEVEHEDVDPHYLFQYDGHFYLLGYSYKRNTFYEYRIDRIKTESISPRSEPISKNQWRRPTAFCYWARERLVQGGVMSHRWLSSSIESMPPSLEDERKGWVLVKATAYNDWRILQQLQKYGETVELIEPLTLREKMKQVVGRLHHLYFK
jgi:predicted DNA-binding transcriptional regulator YafY